MKRMEYILDRKEQELRELQQELLRMIEEEKRAEATFIVAEIVLFLLGMGLGALLMRTFG